MVISVALGKVTITPETMPKTVTRRPFNVRLIIPRPGQGLINKVVKMVAVVIKTPMAMGRLSPPITTTGLTPIVAKVTVRPTITVTVVSPVVASLTAATDTTVADSGLKLAFPMSPLITKEPLMVTTLPVE